MAKVIIIDADDMRRKELTARFRSKGHIVNTMASIQSDSLAQVLSSHNVAIVFDQNEILRSRINEEHTRYKLNLMFVNQNLSINENVMNVFHVDTSSDAYIDYIINKIETYNKSNQITYICNDPASADMFDNAKKVAIYHTTVLIYGETGCGKEVLARFIHQHSTQNKNSFVAINCAAIPESMVESILFGHEKGAFTGALSTHIGKFEQAQNGTLFLDEISELSLPLQAKLLRVLQEKEIERVGGKNTIKINCRIIAATNKDLKLMVYENKFRKDLYYRLNIYPIICPRLTSRKNDIIPLVEHTIDQYSTMMKITKPGLSIKAKQKLLNYEWPGNIRELDNLIQKILIKSQQNVIHEHDIEFDIFNDNRDSHDENIVRYELITNNNYEMKEIIDTLKMSNGSRSLAAKKLNMSARTLRYKIAKLKSNGIDVP